MALEDVRTGESVVVKTGEVIPVDGIVLEGMASINEATITGESVPVQKGVDDTVIGATHLEAGRIVMRATRVGDDTVLAQIIRMVDEATSSKAPVARLADRVSGVFVPVVIVIAIVTALVSARKRRGICAFLRHCRLGDFLPLCFGACYANCGDGGHGCGRQTRTSL